MPSVKALKASLADSLPESRAMAIMNRQKASVAMTGHSAWCIACISGSSSWAPKQQAAKILVAAIPAEIPEATKRAGSTAVLISGKRISAEIRKPV